MNKLYQRILPQLAVACALVAGVQAAPPAMESLAEGQCPRISDPLGRAGMAAVALDGAHGTPQLLMLGGANFPHAKRSATGFFQTGAKVFYDTVEVFSPTLGASLPLGKLPYPVGYAAYAPTDRGMLLAGGCNADGHLSDTLLLRCESGGVTVTPQASLPIPLAYPAFAELDGKLYIFGGQESPDATTALRRCFVWESDAWRELAPMPGEGRMLAAAGVIDGRIYVAGGCSLHPDAEGKAERSYLNSVLVYDPASDTWSEAPSMPETLVAPASPLPVWRGRLLVIGGDPGNYYRAKLAGQEPPQHPGQNRCVYAFDPADGIWTPLGDNCVGIATAPAVGVGNTVYTISGETRPAVRTPVIGTLRLSAPTSPTSIPPTL
ncbi:MAG: kelch repeat-containing protein [Akkermansia sp.]